MVLAFVQTCRRRVLLFGALGSALTTAVPVAWADPVLLRPEATAWVVKPALDDEKESLNVSGVACQPIGAPFRSCLLIGDEKRYARSFRIDGTIIAPGEKVLLLPKEEGDVEWDETDAEGIATDESFYYLVGSHGLNRKGEIQPSRFFVFRVPVDTENGAPIGVAERSAGLRGLIQGVPELKKQAEQPLATEQADAHGVNVEGLAVKNGQLYVGFRGPVRDGTAYVLRVAVDALFDGAPADPKLLQVELGQGLGIRDLATVAGGFLVLAGPEADQGAAPAVFFWDGTGSKPHSLGELQTDLPANTKPEGLLLLGEDAQDYQVLIFRDGAKDGGPAAYRVPKVGQL